jgi:hypothetical protein
MAHHAGGLSWGAVLTAVGADEIVLTVDSARQFRREIGSLYGQFPLPTGHPSVTLAVTRLHDTLAVHTAELAGTRADAAIVFTGSGDNSFTISVYGEIASESYDDPVDGPGVSMQSFTIACFGSADGTESGAFFEVLNANASVAVN